MRRASDPRPLRRAEAPRFGDGSIALALALALGFALAGPGGASAQEMPPAAQPGQCFGRVRFPDAVAVSRHRMLVQGPRRVRRVSPAIVRWTSTRTLVSAAHAETIAIPARYREAVRYVMTAGPSHWAQTPARYRFDSVRVLIAPAHLAWVRGRGTPLEGEVSPGQTLLTPTGEVLCRVRVPARYGERRHRVLVSPARRMRVAGPSQRRRVVERVLVAPARTLTKTHPAVYRSVRRAQIVRPARTTWVVARAQWREVASPRRIERGGWAQVVCPAGLAPWAMQRLQANLSAQGYDAGPADGQNRPQTSEALRRFQRDHRLAEGQITVESARVLGVVP